MNVESVRRFCLALPHATETVQWGNDLVFKVGGKMFAVTCLEPSKVWLSLKATPEQFAELTEREGIIPAPYLARSYWVALESEDALGGAELKQLLRQSYDLVVAGLPKKVQATLQAAATSPPKPVSSRK